MDIKKTVTTILVLSMAFSDTALFAADKSKAAKAIEARKARIDTGKTVKDFTEKDFREAIKESIDLEEDVLSAIPELKRVKGPDGKDSYSYKGVRLEELDKAKLKEAFNRIQNEGARIRAERINKQLESIRQTQAAVANAQQAARARIIVAPPIIVPPSPPRTVQPPPPQQQIPKPPPQPPRR